MHWQSTIASAAATFTLAIGMGFGVSTAASAGTVAVHGGGSVHVPNWESKITARTVVPDISNVKLYSASGLELHQCLQGADSILATPAGGYTSVTNNCEYRVYLQQVFGGTSGWSYCINPHSTGECSADAIQRGERTQDWLRRRELLSRYVLFQRRGVGAGMRHNLAHPHVAGRRA